MKDEEFKLYKRISTAEMRPVTKEEIISKIYFIQAFKPLSSGGNCEFHVKTMFQGNRST